MLEYLCLKVLTLPLKAVSWKVSSALMKIMAKHRYSAFVTIQWGPSNGQGTPTSMMPLWCSSLLLTKGCHSALKQTLPFLPETWWKGPANLDMSMLVFRRNLRFEIDTCKFQAAILVEFSGHAPQTKTEHTLVSSMISSAALRSLGWPEMRWWSLLFCMPSSRCWPNPVRIEPALINWGDGADQGSYQVARLG